MRPVIPRLGGTAGEAEIQHGSVMRTRQSLRAATLAISVIASIWIVDRLTAPDDSRFSFVYMFPLAAAA